MIGKSVKEAIEALYKPIESIVKALAGPGAEEMGLELGDAVRFWRFKRQVRFFKQVQQLCAEAGISPNPVKLTFLFDVLEKASLEDDDFLQDMWANLVTNAADPNYSGLISTAFPEVLKQLSRNEVLFLEAFYGIEPTPEEAERRKKQDLGPTYRTVMAASEAVYRGNLQRLGLIELEPNPMFVGGPPAPNIRDWGQMWFRQTAFGSEFVHACTCPKKRETKNNKEKIITRA